MANTMKNSTEYNLSCKPLCSLRNSSAVGEPSSFLLLDRFCVFVVQGTLYIQHYDDEHTKYTAVFDNVASVCQADTAQSSDPTFLVLTTDVYLLLLTYDGFRMNVTSSAPIDNVNSLSNVSDFALGAWSMAFDTLRSLLCVYSSNSGVQFVLAVHLDRSTGPDDDLLYFDVVVQSSADDERVIDCAVCGAANDRATVIVYGSGTHLDVWTLNQPLTIHTGDDSPPSCSWRVTPSGTNGAEIEPLAATSRPQRLETRHRGWISALSRSVTPCDIAATDDRLGAVLLWRCGTDHRTPHYLFQNTSLCDRRAVTAILIDTADATLWVGDCSGVVTCAHYSLKSKTLERIRRVSLVAVPNGGPSMILWRAEQLLTAVNTNTSGGTLRCYYPQCAVAVECNVPSNVTNAFRVWPEAAKQTEHRSLVELCAVLPHLNFVVTASFAHYLYVWDSETGALRHTIRADDCMYTSLAVCENVTGSDNSYNNHNTDGDARTSHALIASAHSNGKVNVYQLALTVPADDQDDDHSPAGRREYDNTSSVCSALSRPNIGDSAQQSIAGGSDSLLSGTPLFDILEQGGSDLNNTRQLAEEDEDDDESQQLFDDSQSVNNDDRDDLSAPLCTHKVLLSRSFSPLPVSDVFLSQAGGYVAVIYARRFIYVCHIASGKVTRSLTFDAPFCSASVVANPGDGGVHSGRPTSASRAVRADSLVLALQSADKVKLLDAIQGVVLTQFDLHTNNVPAVCCGLWDQLVPTTGDHSIAGVCVARGFELYLFGEQCGFVRHSQSPDDGPTMQFPPLTQQSVKPRSANQLRKDSCDASILDNIVQGVTVFSAGQCPLVAVWSLRRLVLVRVSLESGQPEVVRTVQFRSGDAAVRVVHAQALRFDPRIRVHRAVVVMSDGTAYIVHV